MPTPLRTKRWVPAFKAIPESINTEARTLEAQVSADIVDRDKEIIRPKAFEKRIDSFLSNPQFLWMHNASIPPIGKADELAIGEKNMQAKLRFRPKGTSVLTDDVADAFFGGFLSTFSIGFRTFQIKESRDSRGDMLPTEVVDGELFEISAVTIPANVATFVKAAQCFALIRDSLAECPWREEFPEETRVKVYKAGAEQLAVTPEPLIILKSAITLLDERLEKMAAGGKIPEAELEAIEALTVSALSRVPKVSEEERALVELRDFFKKVG